MLATRRLPPTTGSGDGGGWWQRRELVLALLHPGCAECARLERQLAKLRSSLSDARVHAMAWSERGDRSGPAWEVARALALEAGTALVIVADRYGEVFAVLPVHGADPGAIARDAEGWVEYIQQQCPE